MKKKHKKIRKLSLSVETLRNLEAGKLAQVEGGGLASVPRSACPTCVVDCTLGCSVSCGETCPAL